MRGRVGQFSEIIKIVGGSSFLSLLEAKSSKKNYLKENDSRNRKTTKLNEKQISNKAKQNIFDWA